MLSKKVSAMTPSFTIGISTKVAELKSQGVDIINLSIGEPDFMTPDKAKEAGKTAIDNNKSKYDAAAGLKELRKAIAEKLLTENGVAYTPEQIVVSSGAKHAITNSLIAILDPGDEVIIPMPYWVSYPETVKLLGGEPVFVETQKSNNFKLTKDELLREITDKTKAIVITNPSNPTGALYEKEELEPIVEVCIEKGIWIIADEIYERITYTDGFTSIASLSEEAKNITITINGLSKSSAMTGWRIGYTATPTAVAKAISSIQGHLVSHPCNIAQWAALEAVRSCQADTKRMLEGYRERRNMAIEIIDGIDGLDLIEPNGAFYLFMDISSIKDKVPHENSFSIEVCNRLLEEYKLAVVPGIAFGNDDFIRLSYAADINDVREGLNRIGQLIASVNE